MSQMRTDILGHPPSLCNCRRVWHPAIPTLPSRGCSGLHCTNQARTAPTKLPLHLPTARDFCVFCVFRGTILRNLNICVHLCHLWENYQVGGVGMAGMPYPPKCVPWENTHCLLVYSSLVYLKINDYGYAPGWRSQPKPIVLARHPSSRRGRPSSHP